MKSLLRCRRCSDGTFRLIRMSTDLINKDKSYMKDMFRGKFNDSHIWWWKPKAQFIKQQRNEVQSKSYRETKAIDEYKIGECAEHFETQSDKSTRENVSWEIFKRLCNYRLRLGYSDLEERMNSWCFNDLKMI